MIANYHTHTKRCHHAIGEDEDYVKAAIKMGLKTLGFSDHSPWNYQSGFKPRMRMELKEFEGYLKSIRELKVKYADKINILVGVEAEYFPEYMEWFRNFKKEYELDYVLFGNHFYPDDEKGRYFGRACDDDDFLKVYVNNCIDGLNTGLYNYLAHPDLFMRSRDYFDEMCLWASEKICAYAKERDVILEYNLEGLRNGSYGYEIGYPSVDFWKVAQKYKVKAIVGVDAHDPRSLENSERIDYAYQFLNSLGLEVVKELKL